MRFDAKGIVSFPLIVHLGYWLTIIAIWVLFASVFLGEVYGPFINKLGYLPSQLLVTYYFLYVLFPLLLDRKYFKFALGFVTVSYVSLVLARAMKIYFTETLTGFESDKETISQILMQLDALLVQYMIWVFMTPALTIIIVMILNHYYQGERLALLKKKKQETELRFLKTQLHPHFLFNTLNNLYTLSLTNSPKTANITQRLYEILDFMFHQKGKNVVHLKDELNLLTNYIELEKLRYGNRLQVNLNLSVDDEQIMIIPLLFLSIVENAFKHGASGDLNDPRIDIFLKVKNGKLNFIVRNTKPKKLAEDRTGYKKGIGIKNIKRQLALMYPRGYSYQVNDDLTSYMVELSLNLAEVNLEDYHLIQNPH